MVLFGLGASLMTLLLGIHNQTLPAVMGEHLQVDDPKLVAIREHILKAYFKGRPEPANECEENFHKGAVRLYTRVRSDKEQEEMMADMEASIVNGENDYFMGLGETVSALQSTKIKYILYYEKLYVNSATYRNPLSGKTITLHSIYSPSTVILRNYTDPETGCFMELVNCWPLPKWITKYFKEFTPQITRLQANTQVSMSRNLFAHVSEGIGGRFTEPLKFADNKWLLEILKGNSVRQTVLIRAFQKVKFNGTTHGNETMGDEPLSDEDYQNDLADYVNDGRWKNEG